MWPVLGGLLSGGIGALGSIFGTNSQNQNNQQMQLQAENFDQSMVSQQENFEQNMSNSAYTRASADMKNAGLNPMMMFGSGSAASTPSISAPTIQPANKSSAAGAVASSLQSAIPTAMALRTADATVDNLVEENARIKAATRLAGAEEFSTYQHGHLASSETELKRAALPAVINEALSAKNQTDMDPTIRRLLDQSGFAGRKVSDTVSPISNLVSSARQIGLMSGKGY